MNQRPEPPRMAEMLLADDGHPIPNPRMTPAVIPATLIGRWLHHHRSLLGSRLLDLGAGNQPYRPWYSGQVDQSIALDFNSLPGLAARSAAEALPLRDSCIDSILATEVLEHVEEPEQVMAEAVRVLRPGGHLFITTPFIYPVHEAPYDYWRFTHHGLERICERHGLSTVDVAAKGGLGALTAHVLSSGISRTANAVMARAGRSGDSTHYPVVDRLLGPPQQWALRGLGSAKVSGSARLASLGYMIVAKKP